MEERILKTPMGTLPVKMLSPTDCVKDRLCGYFHWNDLQSLEQAKMVARDNEIDLKELKRWAQRERMEGRYAIFEKQLGEKPDRKGKNA